MSMHQLLELAGSNKGWVSERAQMALMLREQFNSECINASEYNELVMDLIRTDKLDAEADDLELKTALVTAIYAISQVA